MTINDLFKLLSLPVKVDTSDFIDTEVYAPEVDLNDFLPMDPPEDLFRVGDAVDTADGWPGVIIAEGSNPYYGHESEQAYYVAGERRAGWYSAAELFFTIFANPDAE